MNHFHFLDRCGGSIHRLCQQFSLYGAVGLLPGASKEVRNLTTVVQGCFIGDRMTRDELGRRLRIRDANLRGKVMYNGQVLEYKVIIEKDRDGNPVLDKDGR